MPCALRAPSGAITTLALADQQHRWQIQVSHLTRQGHRQAPATDDVAQGTGRGDRKTQRCAGAHGPCSTVQIEVLAQQLHVNLPLVGSRTEQGVRRAP